MTAYDDPDAPWDLIRWVMRQAPYWAARIEGGSRTLVEIPRKGQGTSTGRLSPLQLNYYDLIRAVGEMGWRHPDGAKLALVVALRLQSNSHEAIAVECRRRLPGWKLGRKGVRVALDEAFYWICSPAYGRWFSQEVWDAGRNGREQEGTLEDMPAP